MACTKKTLSHYLSQWWSRPMGHICISRINWVDYFTVLGKYSHTEKNGTVWAHERYLHPHSWKWVSGGGGGGYSSSSREGRLGRTLWPQNSTSVAETEKGGQNSTMTPPPLPQRYKRGVNILHQYEKSAKKRGQKSTILKNIGVKILQVWKWVSKFYMLKNRGQNSTMLEKRGVNILHPTPKVEVKILHRLKKGGQRYPPSGTPFSWWLV